MGNEGPNPILGRGTTIPFAGDGVNTCVSCSGTDFSQFNFPVFRTCVNCALNENGMLGQLTSGYYYGEDREPVPGKCHHGTSATPS
jgi:hypothetical protein